MSGTMQNDALALLAFQELKKLPIMIRNVMLVVNLDSYGKALAGSKILFLSADGNPTETMTLDERCTMLAEVIKRLGLTPVDLMKFVKG